MYISKTSLTPNLPVPTSGCATCYIIWITTCPSVSRILMTKDNIPAALVLYLNGIFLFALFISRCLYILKINYFFGDVLRKNFWICCTFW